MKIIPLLFLCLLIAACSDKSLAPTSTQAESVSSNSDNFEFDTLINKNLQVNFTISNKKLSFSLNGRTVDTDTLSEGNYNSQINTEDPIYGIDINDVAQKENRISLLDSLILFSIHSIPELGFNRLYVCSFKKNTAGFIKTYYQKKTQEEDAIIYQCPYYFTDEKSKSFFLISQDVKNIETNTSYTPVYKYEYINDSVKFDKLILKLKLDSFYSNSSISEMLKRVK